MSAFAHAQNSPPEGAAVLTVVADLPPDLASQLAVELGLKPSEYDRVVEILGRTPTITDIYAVRCELEPELAASLAGRTAQQFIAEELVGRLKIGGVVVGDNFHFGKGRSGRAFLVMSFWLNCGPGTRRDGVPGCSNSSLMSKPVSVGRLPVNGGNQLQRMLGV